MAKKHKKAKTYKKEPRYLLEVSEYQLWIIERALELFARIHTGQIEFVADCFFDKDAYQLFRRILLAVKPEITGIDYEYASHSIFSPEVPEDGRLAYDIYQVIRHSRDKDYPILPAVPGKPMAKVKKPEEEDVIEEKTK